MESFDISSVTIMVLIAIIVIILFTRMRSSYTAGTPANDPTLKVQPQVFMNTDGTIANYKDISTSDTTYANMQLETTAGVSMADANKNCWSKPNCWGIRHTFDPDNAQKTWYVIGTPTQFVTSPVSTISPRLYGTTYYAFPSVFIAAKSTQDPEAPVNCSYSPATSTCSTSACDNPGTQTTTWSKSVTESHGGTCSPAPPSSSVACNTNNPCATSRTVVFSTIGAKWWTVPAGTTSVRVLVVGGGGPGGTILMSGFAGKTFANATGGGGGGGVVENMNYSVTPGQSIYVLVGRPGSGTTPGEDSIFGKDGSTWLVGKGGGSGGVCFNPGSPGGSGGGGGVQYTNGVLSLSAPGGAGITGQGYNGGDFSGLQAGGGGGAGGAGTSQGAGGAGYVSSITGSSVTYGSGGAGGAPPSTACNSSTAGNNATSYGGGGGGGSGCIIGTGANTMNITGGSGNQGIVIIKYMGIA